MTAITKAADTDSFAVTIEGKVTSRYTTATDSTALGFTETQLRALYGVLKVTLR